MLLLNVTFFLNFLDYTCLFSFDLLLISILARNIQRHITQERHARHNTGFKWKLEEKKRECFTRYNMTSHRRSNNRATPPDLVCGFKTLSLLL